MAEEDLKPVPSKGWAEMIRKVYEIDPMACPKCGGQMKVVAFITDYAAVDQDEAGGLASKHLKNWEFIFCLPRSKTTLALSFPFSLSPA